MLQRHYVHNYFTELMFKYTLAVEVERRAAKPLRRFGLCIIVIRSILV